MRSRVLATVLFLACLSVRAQAAGRVKIATLEMAVERGVDPGLARLLDELVLTELSRNYDVLGKSDIAAMLGFEREKTVLGCSDEESCLAEIGGALGVAYLVTGKIGAVGDKVLVSLKLIDAQKATVLSRIAELSDNKED